MKFETIFVLQGKKTEDDAAFPAGVQISQISPFINSAKEVSSLLNTNTGIAVVNVGGRLKMVGLRLLNMEQTHDQ